MSAPPVTVTVDGREVSVEPGTSVAVAVLAAGSGAFRQSVTGEARGVLCGMGICFECRVTVNGVSHRRSCILPCEPGMVVETGG